MKSQLASVPFHNLSLMATEVFMVPIFEDESKKRKKIRKQSYFRTIDLYTIQKLSTINMLFCEHNLRKRGT